MGGEKPLRYGTSYHGRGSPPHGRGKVQKLANGETGIRITPAWAGKSWIVSCFQFDARDHPRMGGEKAFQSKTNRQNMGSPPHGRGKGQAFPQVVTLTGITPAWAGKRLAPAPTGFKSQDHPRMGGEKVVNFGIVKRG